MEIDDKYLCNEFIEHEKVPALLCSSKIKKIKLFALGPYGTNISQASEKWVKEIDIVNKTDIILCSTPEEEIILAMNEKEEGVIPLYALCAVYYDLCKLFFKYGENYTFLHHFYMKLDKLQLASKQKKMSALPENVIIAAHPSPAGLLNDTPCKLFFAKSNADAALICYNNEADACITTEKAKEIYGLNTLKEYGSPSMLFTFGTTKNGIKELEKIRKPTTV